MILTLKYRQALVTLTFNHVMHIIYMSLECYIEIYADNSVVKLRFDTLEDSEYSIKMIYFATKKTRQLNGVGATCCR